MVSSIPQKTEFNLHSVLDSAIQTGLLTRRDHLALTAAMFSDTTLSLAQRSHINQVFDFIRMGRVKLED
jgi:hypothetical protein